MTDDESLQQRRRGYWLARARNRKGLTLSAAAHAAGLSESSGSTVSRWEAGSRPIKVVHLERLAEAYGVRVEFFMRPQVTDDERLDLAAADAATLERQDWEAGQPPGPTDAAGPTGAPGRRSA
jgi:transcriptional regulator with XRE-family HTH domain